MASYYEPAGGMSKIFRQLLGETADYVGGKLGIPETGISEFIAGGNTRNTGNVAYASEPQPTYTQQYDSPIGPQPKSSSDNSTSGSGSGSSGNYNTNGSNTVDQLKGVADAGRSSSIDIIRQRLDEAKRQAREERGRAGQYYEEDRNTINSDVDKLLGRARTRRDETFTTLDNTENDIRDEYGRAGGSARRRSASAERLNRMRARALNRVDSSFYDDIQAENTNELVRTLGSLDSEQAGKIGDVGLQRTKTEDTFTNMFTDIEDQRTKLLGTAKRQYEQAVASADALDRAGVLDFGEGVAQADNEFRSKLAQIQAFIENQATRRLELAATVGNFDNSINAYAPDLSFLTNRGGVERAQNFTGETMANVNTNAGLTMADLLAMTQRKPDEDYLY